MTKAKTIATGHVVNDERTSLLPENATAFEVSHSEIDQRLLKIDTDIIRRERQAPTATAPLLPFLAWERSLHHWTGTDAATDRARTASSFDDHAGYGAPATLEIEIQQDTGYSAIAIREFFEVRTYAWPDFQVVVTVTADGPQPPSVAALYASAIARKNVRDWPAEIVFELIETGPLGIGSASVLNATLKTLPLDPTPRNSGTIYHVARGSITATIQSLPF